MATTPSPVSMKVGRVAPLFKFPLSVEGIVVLDPSEVGTAVGFVIEVVLGVIVIFGLIIVVGGTLVGVGINVVVGIGVEEI